MLELKPSDGDDGRGFSTLSSLDWDHGTLRCEEQQYLFIISRKDCFSLSS